MDGAPWFLSNAYLFGKARQLRQWFTARIMSIGPPQSKAEEEVLASHTRRLNPPSNPLLTVRLYPPDKTPIHDSSSIALAQFSDPKA